jgi:antitoxin component of MazEF toxin-antitoxin module
VVKKLSRTGNSLALVFDKPLLEQLDIDADTPLEISTDGQVLVISPVRSKRRQAQIKAALDQLDERYAGVFRRLAE